MSETEGEIMGWVQAYLIKWQGEEVFYCKKLHPSITDTDMHTSGLLTPILFDWRLALSRMLTNIDEYESNAGSNKQITIKKCWSAVNFLSKHSHNFGHI